MNRTKENTWRKLNGQQELRSMKDVVISLQKYIATYDNQQGYEDYSDELFIEDILYGLGAALGEEYKFALGFEKFKDLLRNKFEKERHQKQVQIEKFNKSLEKTE